MSQRSIQSIVWRIGPLLQLCYTRVHAPLIPDIAFDRLEQWLDVRAAGVAPPEGPEAFLEAARYDR